MDDEQDHKPPAAIVWGILSPVLDWSPEERAAALEPDNVIWLDQYRTVH